MKTRHTPIWILIAIIVIALSTGFAVSRMDISALNPPDRIETSIATFAKRHIVAHEAANMHVNEPVASAASASTGQVLFSVECATCHGKDGRSPTHIGQSMYPRVPDLGSAEIQSWSNPQLFWIIENGVRLSGMPAFRKFDTDEQLWHLVHYIRTLPLVRSRSRSRSASMPFARLL